MVVLEEKSLFTFHYKLLFDDDHELEKDPLFTYAITFVDDTCHPQSLRDHCIHDSIFVALAQFEKNYPSFVPEREVSECR